MLDVSHTIGVARDPKTAPAVLRATPARFSPPSAAPPVVVWNVIRHCNMTCPHCYASASTKRSRFDLDWDEARRLLSELASGGVRVIIFSGGEPLLRPDLFKLIEYARSVGLAPQLSTNGVLIDRPVARRLREIGIGYVGVSIDGPASYNDRYRGLEDGFHRATGALRILGEEGLRTGLRMTLTRDNAAFLDEMIDLAVNLGVDRFYVSHLLYSGRGLVMESADLRPAESRKLLLALFDRADALLASGAKTFIATGGNDSDGPLLLHWIEARYGRPAAEAAELLLAQRGGNSAGEKILNVDHRGRVHPDQFWQGMVLGDLREQSFQEILRHPFRAELRDRASRLGGRCGSCRFLSLCRGSHRERALASSGDLWGADPSCVLTDLEVAQGPATTEAPP